MQYYNRQNILKLSQAILTIIEKNKKPSYLPDWLHKFWQPDTSDTYGLKADIQNIIDEYAAQEDTLELCVDKLLKRLDLERYVVAVHLNDLKMRARIQDAMVTALFFSEEDIKKFNEYVLAEQIPNKFIEYLSQNQDLLRYKEYLRKQQSLYGRFSKNFTDEELTLVAKAYIIHSKLLEYFGLIDFLKHGFYYAKKELKALQLNKIEKGYLTFDRINGYLDKMSLLMHPANELHQDKEALVRNCRNLLEDIVNTASLKEAGKPMFSEHQAVIAGCYWVDEMFKSAAASLKSIEL